MQKAGFIVHDKYSVDAFAPVEVLCVPRFWRKFLFRARLEEGEVCLSELYITSLIKKTINFPRTGRLPMPSCLSTLVTSETLVKHSKHSLSGTLEPEISVSRYPFLKPSLGSII